MKIFGVNISGKKIVSDLIASMIPVDASSYSNFLTSSDNNIQKVADKVNTISVGADQYVKVNSSDSVASYLDGKIVVGSGITKTILDSVGVKTLSLSTATNTGKILVGGDYSHIITAPQVNQWRGDDFTFDFPIKAGKYYEVELHLWLSYVGAGSVVRSFGLGSSTESPIVDSSITAYGTVEMPDTSSPYAMYLSYGANTPYQIKTGFDVNVTSGTGKYVRAKYYITTSSDKTIRLYHKSTTTNTLTVKVQSRMVYHEI